MTKFKCIQNKNVVPCIAMKRLFQIVTICLLSLQAFNAKAQSFHNEKVVSLNVGYTIVGGLVRTVLRNHDNKDSMLAEDNSIFNNFEVTNTRAIILGFDYGISETWSLGGIIATQKWYGTADYQFKNIKGEDIQEEIDFTLRRSNISFCPKVHYGSSSHSDLYSGIRVGFLLWNNKIVTSDETFNKFSKLAISRPNFSFTVIGARVYVNNHIGANFEFNLGAPNVIGFGLNYKFE